MYSDEEYCNLFNLKPCRGLDTEYLYMTQLEKDKNYKIAKEFIRLYDNEVMINNKNKEKEEHNANTRKIMAKIRAMNCHMLLQDDFLDQNTVEKYCNDDFINPTNCLIVHIAGFKNEKISVVKMKMANEFNIPKTHILNISFTNDAIVEAVVLNTVAENIYNAVKDSSKYCFANSYEILTIDENLTENFLNRFARVIGPNVKNVEVKRFYTFLSACFKNKRYDFKRDLPPLLLENYVKMLRFNRKH